MIAGEPLAGSFVTRRVMSTIIQGAARGIAGRAFLFETPNSFMRLRLTALALLFAAAAVLPADEVRTLAGKSLSGSLSSMNGSMVVVETKDGPVSTPLTQVLAIDLQPIKGVPAGAK